MVPGQHQELRGREDRRPRVRFPGREDARRGGAPRRHRRGAGPAGGARVPEGRFQVRRQDEDMRRGRGGLRRLRGGHDAARGLRAGDELLGERGTHHQLEISQ